MIHTLQLSLALCLGVVLVRLMHAQEMTECERGVKRPHPSQENVYQLFTRTQWSSSWIDLSCPAPQVFNQEQCACVEPAPTTPPTTPPTIPPTVPPTNPEPKKTPWFDRPKHVNRRKQNTANDGQRRRKIKQDTVPFEDDVPVRHCKDFRPGESPTQYQQKTQDGSWVTLDCNWPAYSGLVWSQELCRCDWGPNRTNIARLQYDSAPAKCLMMLKLNFDDGEVKDVGRELWLDLRHPLSMEAVRDETAVGGWSGAFWGAGISVPFFKQNTFGSTFRIKFRFQICDGHPDADLMLINNGCIESEALPSLQVSYRAWTSVLAFQMETMQSLGPYREECLIQEPSQHKWIDINIHYDQNTLEIFANGVQCVRSAAFAGPIMPIDCPLTLLEDNFCGMLDEVMMTRGCTPTQEQ